MPERGMRPAEKATWTRAAIGSVVFHIGLVFVASVLPDGSERGGGSERDRLFTPGAVIPIETLPRLAAAEPTGASLPLPAPNPDQPATAPLEQPRSATPTPESGSRRPPEPTEAESEPSQTPGLSLHGMRSGARASVRTKGPGFDPAALQGSRAAYEDSVNNPGVGAGAVQGPAAPPSAAADYSFRREKGKLVYRDPSGRFVATLRADGRVDFRNKGAKASWTQIGLGGPGDLLTAAAGDDPYARIKAKLLKATFEMRLGMAVNFQKKQLDKRLRRLDGELEKIWVDQRRTLADRKELLFQRWDECDEPEEVAKAAASLPGFGEIDSSDLDDARQDAARSARKRIETFIRKNAPRGSDVAFTASELADMNRRRVSKQAFKPYG